MHSSLWQSTGLISDTLSCSLLPFSHKARLMKRIGLGWALTTASPLALLEGIAREWSSRYPRSGLWHLSNRLTGDSAQCLIWQVASVQCSKALYSWPHGLVHTPGYEINTLFLCVLSFSPLWQHLCRHICVWCLAVTLQYLLCVGLEGIRPLHAQIMLKHIFAQFLPGCKKGSNNKLKAVCPLTEILSCLRILPHL